nr:transcription factor bHLH96-like [Ipomoea batatas]
MNRLPRRPPLHDAAVIMLKRGDQSINCWRSINFVKELRATLLNSWKLHKLVKNLPYNNRQQNFISPLSHLFHFPPVLGPQPPGNHAPPPDKGGGPRSAPPVADIEVAMVDDHANVEGDSEFVVIGNIETDNTMFNIGIENRAIAKNQLTIKTKNFLHKTTDNANGKGKQNTISSVNGIGELLTRRWKKKKEDGFEEPISKIPLRRFNLRYIEAEEEISIESLNFCGSKFPILVQQ